MIYNISAPNTPPQIYSGAEILAAAAEGLPLTYTAPGCRIPCRVAAACRGYITAVTARGAILQAWAGDFTARINEEAGT